MAACRLAMVSGAAFFLVVFAGDFPRCCCCFSLAVFESFSGAPVAPLASSLALALVELELLGTDFALRSNLSV